MGVQLGGGVQQTFTPYGWRTARSSHSGGANLIFADGSLQFISDTIELDIWRAIATIAGGETVASP
jgi:prepilin-type processing-associated H-X9-DG protein